MADIPGWAKWLAAAVACLAAAIGGLRAAMGAAVTPGWEGWASVLEVVSLCLVALCVVFVIFGGRALPWYERAAASARRRRRSRDIYGVRFLVHHSPYRQGEVAGFSAGEAIELVEAGEAAFVRRRDRQRAIRGLSRLERGGRIVELDYKLVLWDEEPHSPDQASAIQEARTRLGLDYVENRKKEHTLVVRFHVRAKIDPPALHIECSAPIYGASGFRQDSRQGEPLFISEPARRQQERMLFVFGDTPIPRGAGLLLIIETMAPAHLTRAVVATRPPAPPATTAPASPPPSSPGSSG